MKVTILLIWPCLGFSSNFRGNKFMKKTDTKRQNKFNDDLQLFGLDEVFRQISDEIPKFI
jgi:hypothetical protein